MLHLPLDVVPQFSWQYTRLISQSVSLNCIMKDLFVEPHTCRVMHQLVALAEVPTALAILVLVGPHADPCGNVASVRSQEQRQLAKLVDIRRHVATRCSAEPLPMGFSEHFVAERWLRNRHHIMMQKKHTYNSV